MKINEQILDLFEDIYRNLNKILFDHLESKDYPALSKIIDCMGLFINFTHLRFSIGFLNMIYEWD